MFKEAVFIACVLACAHGDLPQESSLTLGYRNVCFDGNPDDSMVVGRPVGKACNAYKARSPGLTGTSGTISLQSVVSPSYFLRHQGYQVKLHELFTPDPGSLEAKDASFFPEESADHPGWYQFRSENFPDHKIARHDQGLNIVRDDGSADFVARSLFRYSPSGTELVLFDDDSICYDANQEQDILRARAIQDCMQYRIIPALTGTNGAVTFEARDHPDYFLRHQGYFVKLHHFVNPPPDSLEAKDASFIPRAAPGHPGFYQFVSVNFPSYVIGRVSGARLQIVWDDGSRELLGTTLFQFSGVQQGVDNLPASDLQFTLPYNGRSYVLVQNQDLSHGTEAVQYCNDNYGYTLAYIESPQHQTALSAYLLGIQASTGYQLGEVTTAERTKAPMDADVTMEEFNQSAWHCVVLAGDDLGMVAKKCFPDRTTLCAAPNLC